MNKEKLTILRNASEMESHLVQILNQGWDTEQHINNPLLQRAETELTLEGVVILLLTVSKSYTRFHPCGGIEAELHAKMPRFIDALVANTADAEATKEIWKELQEFLISPHQP